MRSLSDLMPKIRENLERAREISLSPEGRKRFQEYEEREAREKAEAEQKYRLEAWKRRNVPKRLWEALQATVMTSALARVQRFLEPGNKDWILFLSGGVGTGKTFAAAWAVANTPKSYFTKAAAIQSAGPFDREFRTRLEAVDLLAIDELGSEILDQKQFSRAYLFQLLDARYDGAQKTIVTTNSAVGDFRKTYGNESGGPGQRLWDRIRESGAYFHVEESDSLRAAANLVAMASKKRDD